MEKYFEKSEEESEEIEIDYIGIIKKGLLNEIYSPEILKYKEKEIKHLLIKIEEKMDEIYTNIQEKKNEGLKINIIQLEIERIKYLISSYLRIRLKKV
jgi:GINS complex subunit 4